jgi:hypothetical protein
LFWAHRRKCHSVLIPKGFDIVVVITTALRENRKTIGYPWEEPPTWSLNLVTYKKITVKFVP